MSDSHDDTNGPASGAGDARSNTSAKKSQKQQATVSSGVGASGQRPAGGTPATPPPPPAGRPQGAAGQPGPSQGAPAQSGTHQGGTNQPDKSAAKKAPAKKSAPRKNAQSASGQKQPQQPGANQSAPQGGAGQRPLTAADYAGTTRGSAETTSIMPAIKDEPGTSAARTAQQPAAQAAPTGRRAKLRLKHIEPWSVTRLAFVVSVALMIVAVVAVTIFWIVLDITGVWDQFNGSVTNVLADDSGDFDVTDYLGLGRLVGLTLVLSAINVIIMTALATIGAHLYNLAAQLLGGVEVTFGED